MLDLMLATARFAFGLLCKKLNFLDSAASMNVRCQQTFFKKLNSQASRAKFNWRPVYQSYWLFSFKINVENKQGLLGTNDEQIFLRLQHIHDL